METVTHDFSAKRRARCFHLHNEKMNNKQERNAEKCSKYIGVNEQ